jgi:steroid delta-isomerase-like uncharacterized protein
MENREIARGFFEELFSKGKLDFIDQNVDAGYRGNESLGKNITPAQLKNNVQMYRKAFPDLTAKIDELVEATDKILVRWTCVGTHRGDFLGKPATGKRSEIKGISVMTFRNGKLVEDHTQWDVFGLLKNLGISSEAVTVGAAAPAP